MKKSIIFTLFGLLISPSLLFAQPPATEPSAFPVTNWISKNSSDPVTIQNGAGTPMLIVINVAGGGSTQSPGVNVKNCGSTAHINAGSSTLCETNDPTNPVTLTSDSGANPATGTYQLKAK